MQNLEQIITKEIQDNFEHEYLGCKNRDLLFQLNKLKQTTGILAGDINGYISKQSVLFGGPDISELKTNLDLNLQPGNSSDKDYVLSLFYTPGAIQIISSVNLSENKQDTTQSNIFVNINKLVYAVNLQRATTTQTNKVFLIDAQQSQDVDMVVNDLIFNVFGNSRVGSE
jgi:hypothetical protein